MSRSKKKNPGGGFTTARSEKSWKKKAHRRFRRRIKTMLSSQNYEDIEVFPDYDSIVNAYLGPKDGKQYWVDHSEEWMRK